MSDKKRDGKSLTDLVEVMATLRGEQGCPWDKEQTFASLKKYLVEETYEVLEALDEENMHKLQEELGDLLLQITFHAQIAAEKGYFNMDDVIDGIVTKMKRRHPHVFGSDVLDSSEEVLVKWEEIKEKEKGKDRFNTVLDVPKNFPALYRAQKLQQKAARVGFDWPDISGVWDKISEETGELKEAIKENYGIQDELGDVLFAIVNLARFLGVDSEEALQGTNKKFVQRFSHIEEEAKKNQRALKELTLEEMNDIWQEAKKHKT